VSPICRVRPRHSPCLAIKNKHSLYPLMRAYELYLRMPAEVGVSRLNICTRSRSRRRYSRSSSRQAHAQALRLAAKTLALMRYPYPPGLRVIGTHCTGCGWSLRAGRHAHEASTLAGADNHERDAIGPWATSGCSAATLDQSNCRKLSSIPFDLMLEVATPAVG
jgi:hypothetical protein